MKFSVFTFFLLISVQATPLFSQVINPPKIQCIINDVSNNNIDIFWSNINNSCGPFIEYLLYRSANLNGPYTLIASIPNQAQTTYTDPGVGGGPWFYYMEANYNCPGFSILPSDTLENLPPAIPELINVTVIGNTVQVNWEPSSSPNTFYYIVYYAGYNSILIDTLFGINNTTYIDLNGFPDQQSVPYTIQAFDSCNQSINTNFDFHRTIFLESEQDLCERRVLLSWNRYINWPEGVQEYRILSSTNGSLPQVVATVDSGTFNYTYTGYNDFDTLCFTIRAVSRADTNITSNSNQRCFVASIVQPPAYMYITGLTVNASNQVEIQYMIDTLAELATYEYEVSDDGSMFTRFKQDPAPVPVNLFQNIVDSNNNPGIASYYHRLNAIDDCGDEYQSSVGRTVFLQTELTDFFENSLTWNNFEMEYAVINNYNVFRDFGSGYQFIASLPAGQTSLIDDVSELLEQRGEFCYQIEAEYRLNLPNGYSKNSSSFSNIGCIDQRVLIYIPPVFVPTENPGVFKPTILFGNTNNYRMSIFNRWGEIIFETVDINIGWDGTVQGNPAPLGGYVYIVELTGVDGTPIQEEGIFTLIR